MQLFSLGVKIKVVQNIISMIHSSFLIKVILAYLGPSVLPLYLPFCNTTIIFEMPIFDMEPHVTIVAHSGGGGALRTLAKEKILAALRPDVIVMSEASYGNWADQVWGHYVKAHPECKLVFLLLKGGEPYRRTQRLLKRIGDTPREIGIKIYESPKYSHVKVGDHALIDSARFVYEQ